MRPILKNSLCPAVQLYLNEVFLQLALWSIVDYLPKVIMSAWTGSQLMAITAIIRANSQRAHSPLPLGFLEECKSGKVHGVRPVAPRQAIHWAAPSWCSGGAGLSPVRGPGWMLPGLDHRFYKNLQQAFSFFQDKTARGDFGHVSYWFWNTSGPSEWGPKFCLV